MKTHLTNARPVSVFTKPGKFVGTVSGNVVRFHNDGYIWQGEIGLYVKGIDVPCLVTVDGTGVIEVEL